jgi:isopentenyldiphosphate isomerase
VATSDVEQVALVDRRGAVVGVADRREVRRANLLHSATAVIVRDPHGRIYVHRRSDRKDLAPSHYDVAAGGVLLYGETPEQGARRELREELGIEGVTLEALPGVRYEDATVRCFLHAFTATYDGTVRHLDGEVVWGAWMTLDELAARLRREDWLFVPDTLALLRALGEAGIDDYRGLRSAATPDPRSRAGLDTGTKEGTSG